MIWGLVIAGAFATFAYMALSLIEDRVRVRKRVSQLTMQPQEKNAPSINRQKILSIITDQSKKKSKSNKALADLLIKAGLSYRPGQVRMGLGLLGGLIALMSFFAFQNLIISLVAFLLVFLVVPHMGLNMLIFRREGQFLEELPNALDIMSRGLRAGMPLAVCLKQITDSTSEPLRSEFAQVIDLQKLGVPLSDAIRKMPDRMDLMDLRFFTIVIEVQQKSGGNLAEILGNISEVIRGRRELKAKIKALIAEAKVSSIIIGIMPVGFAAMSYYSDPMTFSRFWTEPIGQVLGLLCLFLYGAGILIFIKIANVRA